MTTQDILTAIGLIGVGGLLKSLIDYLISSKKQKSEIIDFTILNKNLKQVQVDHSNEQNQNKTPRR